MVQGVTGGVTSFPEFEKKFFPEVTGQDGGGQGVAYCQYDNQALQLFTSSLYLAGIFSTLVGGYTSRCSPQRWILLSLCDALTLCAIRRTHYVQVVQSNAEACCTTPSDQLCPSKTSWGQNASKCTASAPTQCVISVQLL